MASPIEPMTGRAPMPSPRRRLPLRFSVHMPKAPTGPAAAARPRENSSITPVEPIRITKRKYGSRKVRPPYLETIQGKRQMLAMPTAEPMQARMKPHLLWKPSRRSLVLRPIIVTTFLISVEMQRRKAPA